MTLVSAQVDHRELIAKLLIALVAIAVSVLWLIKWPSRAARRDKRLAATLRKVELLNRLGDSEIDEAVKSLEVRTFKAGDVVYRQDDPSDDCFFVEAGECYAEKAEHTFESGLRVKHARHGVGTVAEVTKDPNITRVVFDIGESHRYVPASLHKLKPVAAIEPRVSEVQQYRSDGLVFFGERALSRMHEPRPATITCRTDVVLLRLAASTFLSLKRQQDRKENLLRGVSIFETFSDDQIAQVACMMRPQEYEDRQTIIRQGDHAYHLFIVDRGEAVATIQRGQDEQEVMRYREGGMFGEKALLDGKKRAATITAIGVCRVWSVSRKRFEATLGTFRMLQSEQYLADPRNLIANFYAPGDATGPAGSLIARGKARAARVSIGGTFLSAAPKRTSWFAVYRPCSRDSIAKMVGRVGTGKGLNIKGKSAKRNRLSGFVPFCQISKNEDKAALEATPRDARTRVFYQSEVARAAAQMTFESALEEMKVEQGKKMQMERPEVDVLSEYEPGAFGLDVPEGLLKEVYIMRPDVTPIVGWETGRDSEPAFLDMNRHALRDGGSPPVVLYQFDQSDPMNPLGLLMAYAEERVTPVVSDFDTFLVGSRGVHYEETPPEQVELIHWCLDHATALLAEPHVKGWMAGWLDVLKTEARKGFHPALPKYGFGDPTSYRLIGDIVQAVSECGAVRHGAECFNFYFPQELDPEFLVVWDGFSAPPWRTLTEPELRTFLLARAREGFSFPINPVWPVRDAGWLAVLHELQAHDEAATNLESWFPPESGIVARIEKIHARHGPSAPTTPATNPRDILSDVRPSVRTSFWNQATDCESEDVANLSLLEVRRESKARWRRVQAALRMKMLKLSSGELDVGALGQE